MNRRARLGEDEPAAFTLVLQALLSSAEFLYRIELDPDPESTAGHPLGPFELASRLSYFLWSSAPDDSLLDAASNGSLLNAEVLSAAVDRMLADSKSERFVANFAGQWLGAREVLSHPVGPQFFKWSRPMAQAASQEILLYFSHFLRSGRSWFEFPTADVNFVDAALAYFYGMPTEARERRQVRAGRGRRRQTCRLLRPGRIPVGHVARPTHVALTSRTLDREQPPVQGSAAAAAGRTHARGRSTGRRR